MLQPVNRLRYKVVTSFAIAACAFLGIARITIQTQASSQAFFVDAILAILAVAGIWRGLIYVRAVREMG
jgi:hypothetical protein